MNGPIRPEIRKLSFAFFCCILTEHFSLQENKLLAVTMSESGRDSARLRCDDHPFGYIEDIMINILTRLPAKTVGACKSVAKHFLKLISEPDFPLMHLAMSTRNLKYIICSYPVVRDRFGRLFVIEDGEISEDISLPYFGSRSTPEMSCFPNGLICCVHEYYSEMPDVDIQIFNPLTKDIIILPRGSTSVVVPTVGVAFDPIRNDYRAYRFFSNSAERVGEKFMCEVYTASSKEWQTISEDVKRPTHSLYHPHCPFYASVAGVMYWFVWSDNDPGTPDSVLSVDMNCNFTKIDLPAELSNWSFLIEFEGCPAVVHMDDPDLYDRDQYGNSQHFLEIFKLEKGEWNLRLRTVMMVDLSDVYCFNSVAVKDSEMFFIVQLEDESFEYIVFDFVEETLLYVDDLYEDLEGYFPVAYPFAESLLNPSEM